MEKGEINSIAVSVILIYACKRLLYCMQLKLTLIFSFVLIWTAPVYAQNPSIVDSLKRNIQNYLQEDSFRVKAIFQYVKSSGTGKSNEMLPYIEEMLRISKKINYSYGARKGHLVAVLYFGDRSDFIKSFLHADTMALLLQNDSSYSGMNDQGLLYLNTGNNYYKMGDYQKAISCYISAASNFEKINNQVFAANVYLNISGVYEVLNNTEKAVEYTSKAFMSAENTSNDGLRAAVMLSYVADLLKTKDVEKAENILSKVKPLVEKLDNSYTFQNYFFYKGAKERSLNNNNAALVFYKKSLGYAYENEDIHQVVGVMKELSDCYLNLNDLPLAKIYLDSILILANTNKLQMPIKQAYEGLSEWYEKSGDFKTSKRFLQQAYSLNDSLASEEKKKQIADLEIKYQVQGKENEIKNLKTAQEITRLSIRQKNTLNYILIGSAAILLLISLLSYRNYKQKQKLQQQRIIELETEKKLTATEAVLKGEEQERTRLAKDLHDGLGGMLSGIKYSFNSMKGNIIMTPDNAQAFERSMDMLDSSIKEMRRVAHNLMPEALVKFGLDTALKDFCNDINQSGALKVTYQSVGLENSLIEQRTSISVYRIVQELINNSMKHASARTAIVQVAKTDGNISITVEDDGKGFDPAILKGERGIGWSNIQSRIEYLKGKLDVQSEPGKGTSVLIEFNA
jgi:signal transduction histidine kinase